MQHTGGPVGSDVARRQVATAEFAIAVGVGFVGASAYLATMCQTVFWYDSAEYAAAAHTLGIPHPPGYPLYTLIGHLFTRLFSDPAYALNLMSATFGGVAVSGCYLLARRLGTGRTASAMAAMLLAQNPVFWRNAVVAEVYTPALAALAAVWCLALLAIERGRASLLVAASLIAGLGLGLHLFLATTGLGLALLVWGHEPSGETGAMRQLWHRPSLARRLRLSASCLAATCVGASIFVWIPIRASMGPAVNFEDPSTLERFMWMLSGGQYKHWFVSEISGARMMGIVRIFIDYLSLPGLIAGATGIALLLRRRPLIAVALALGIIGNIWFFFDYRVHDVEVFFLPAGLLTTAASAVTADAVLKRCTRRRWVGGLLVSTSAVLILTRSRESFVRNDLASYTEPRDWAEQVCQRLPTDAIIVNYTTFQEWKYDAVFRSYYQVVLDRRRDVHVALAPPGPAVAMWLAQGRDVFAYHPIGRISKHFMTTKEGPMYRVRARTTRP
ncbi:MAG: DUF2723 domain-containing protein [Nannocystaceae bacterium]